MITNSAILDFRAGLKGSVVCMERVQADMDRMHQALLREGVAEQLACVEEEETTAALMLRLARSHQAYAELMLESRRVLIARHGEAMRRREGGGDDE